MKKNSEMMYEIALKISKDSILLEHALSQKSVYGMLLEKIEDDDIEKLRGAIQQSMTAVDTNIKASNQFKLTSIAKYFENIKKALEKGNNLVAKLDMSDPDTISAKIGSFFGKKVDTGRALQSVIDLQNKSNTAAKTLANALDLITKNLDGKAPEDLKLSDLDKEEHGVDADMIKQGVSKAFKASKPKGFMAKLGSLLRKSPIAEIPGAEEVGELPVDAVQEEILGLTLADLKNLGGEADKSAQTADQAAVPTDTIKDVQADAEEDSEKAGSSEEKSEEKSSEEDSGDAPENPEEESDPGEEIKAAASAAKSKSMSPKDAIGKALSDWEESLSKSSKQALSAAGRSQKLRDAVFSGVDAGKDAVQKAVADAVKAWRSENEETLIKGKRFAKKNFDSLEKMIPALAAQVLAQSNESSRKITNSYVKKYVYKRLNKKFSSESLLFEKWQKNAGLLR